MKNDLKEDALRYHREGRPGKIEIGITKPCATQRDLSLAYTPGVAEPCREIERDPAAAYDYTARGNLIAVITNGTAVLGLGDIGPLAGKPVMEGKALLFKRFADVDAFDIEVDEKDPARLIQIVKSLEPTFGGINLEDIKAPECFEIERQLIEAMDIPVFHDDQHGTAIITTAGLMNALEITGRKASDVRVVFSGAGAAAVACARMIESLGVPVDNIYMCDRRGLITHDRAEQEPWRGRYAKKSKPMDLAACMKGADVFVGLSAGGIVSKEMVRSMAARPIIFAMANPDPEIMPEDARAAAPEAIIATGRSDYPNQINNVLGFPFIFRGALDVRARRISEGMKMAAARSLAALAREPVSRSICEAYKVGSIEFGPDYIIPKPLDPRVLLWEAPAVAAAATEEGLARRPKGNVESYCKELAERLKIAR
ncbi:MAG: malate dehydrogenase [Proteobacteria bacterium]|nr:malate dehydrogenase [Pseudomonadota bacterium]